MLLTYPGQSQSIWLAGNVVLVSSYLPYMTQSVGSIWGAVGGIGSLLIG